MNTYELNFLSKAINNENNENITELDKDSIIAEKDDVINKLNLPIQKKNKLLKKEKKIEKIKIGRASCRERV